MAVAMVNSSVVTIGELSGEGLSIFTSSSLSRPGWLKWVISVKSYQVAIVLSLCNMRHSLATRGWKKANRYFSGFVLVIARVVK